MKKIATVFTLLLFFAAGAQAQGLKGLLKKATSKDSSGKSSIDQLKNVLPGNKSGGGLSNDDIISGLKEALRVGTDSSAKRLSKADGFFWRCSH